MLVHTEFWKLWRLHLISLVHLQKIPTAVSMLGTLLQEECDRHLPNIKLLCPTLPCPANLNLNLGQPWDNTPNTHPATPNNTQRMRLGTQNIERKIRRSWWSSSAVCSGHISPKSSWQISLLSLVVRRIGAADSSNTRRLFAA